jgi:hypothetical protein
MHTRGNQAAAKAAHILMSMQNLTKASYKSLVNMTMSGSANVRNKAHSELRRRLRNAVAQMSSASATNTVRRLRAALGKQ